MKPLEWVGDSRECIRRFPEDARRASGHQLERVQAGEDPSDFKNMPSVGLGVQELRIRIGGAFRVIYVAKFSEAIYVLHAFQKKSRQTNKSDIDLARQRFRALLQERKRK
jgi:phage-related protein